MNWSHVSRLVFLALLTLSMTAPASPQDTSPPIARRCDAIGDGVADDTAAIQRSLDSGDGTVYLPGPPKCYLISRPLVIHSNQTLQADRFAVIRLKDNSDCPMLAVANARHAARSFRPSSTSSFPRRGFSKTSWRTTDSLASTTA